MIEQLAAQDCADRANLEGKTAFGVSTFIGSVYGPFSAFLKFRIEVAEMAEKVLALGHKKECTSPFGYPEKCSCGFGALVKPMQELRLTAPAPVDPQIAAMAARIAELERQMDIANSLVNEIEQSPADRDLIEKPKDLCVRIKGKDALMDFPEFLRLVNGGAKIDRVVVLRSRPKRLLTEDDVRAALGLYSQPLEAVAARLNAILESPRS